MKRRPPTLIFKCVNWLLVILLLVPEVALAAGLAPAGTTQPAPFPALSATQTPLTTAKLSGRIIFSPTIDNDNDPATNPISPNVPVVDLMGVKSGYLFLAAQLMADGETIGLPVTFRVWSDAGYDHTQTIRSDAWGAASLRLLPEDLAAGYAYQASAPGFGSTEVRYFRFDPNQASYIMQPEPLTLWHSQNGSRITFSIRSPRPLDPGRDVPVLLLGRRPTTSTDPETAPILHSFQSNGAGVLLPEQPMQIVDQFTAQVEVVLPAGQYAAVASLTVNGQPTEQFYSEAALFEVNEVAPAPNTPAIWVSDLEYEAGQWLVQYHSEPGRAIFALQTPANIPPLSQVWLNDSRIVQSRRIGPFEWHTDVYDVNLDVVVDDGNKKITLNNFEYDPLQRRYTIAVQSLLAEPITDTMRIDVFGAGGVIIHHEERQVVLRPEQLFTYDIVIPAELGQPHGLRVVLDDPLEAVINAIRSAGLAFRDLIVNHGSFQITVAASADAIGIKILEAKLVLTLPISSSDGLSFSWFPDGSTIPDLYNSLRTYLLNGAWDFDNLVIDVGGGTLETKFSLGLSFPIDIGQCPDDESKAAMETSLRMLAESLNVGFGDLKAKYDLDPDANWAELQINLFWFLAILGKLNSPKFLMAASADGLSLRIAGEFTFGFALRLIVDLFPFDWFFENAEKLKESLEAGYRIAMILQAISVFVLKGHQLLNTQLTQANCTPLPDLKPPDDRQDVWQSFGRMYRGETAEESIANLNEWLTVAQTNGLWRAEDFLLYALRQAELEAFNSNLAAFDDYLEQNWAIMSAAHADQLAIISGTLPISPTQTITEAVLWRGEQAYVQLEALPYLQQQRQLLDALAIANRDYAALFGEELELQHELQQLLFEDRVGLAATGLIASTETALAWAGLPYSYVNLWPGSGAYAGRPAPYIPPEIAPRLLIIPAGGLHTIANSAEAGAWLEEYVAGGGLLVVFTQPFGSDWNVLPGGQVRGVGYNEDQRCQQASVQAARPSDWLIWMGVEKPDIQVDGAFTAWPANANILLTRAWGLMKDYPAMIEYDYGSGRVLATAAYGDWAVSTGISWGDDWQMTRTILLRAYLLSQGQDVANVPAVPPNTPFTPLLTITNTAALTTSQVMAKVPAYNPTSSAIAYNGQVATMAAAIPAGDSLSLSPTLRTPPKFRGVHTWSRIGLYRLYLSQQTVDNLGHASWGPYVRVTGNITADDLSLTLAASPTIAELHETATVTATIANYSASPQTVVLTGEQGLTGMSPLTVTIPAGTLIHHTHTLPISQSLVLAARLRQGGLTVSEARLNLYLASPAIQLAAHIPAVFDSGASLPIVLNNNPVFAWQHPVAIFNASLELSLADPNGGQVWSQSQPLPTILPGEQYTATFTAGALGAITLGDYRLTYRVLDDIGQVIGSGQATIPAGVVLDGTFDQAAYRIRKTAVFTGYLQNAGRIPLTPQALLEIPALAHSDSQPTNLPVGGTALAPFAFPISDSLSDGLYPLLFSADQNGLVSRQFLFTIPPATIEASLPQSTLNAGDNLTVVLNNVGGQDGLTDYQAQLSDSQGVVVMSHSGVGLAIPAGQSLTLTLPIPAGTASGVYQFQLNGQEQTAGGDYALVRLPMVNGVTAGLDVYTNQLLYPAGQTITATGQVAALQANVSGTLTLTIAQAGRANPETALLTGPNQMVNDNDEQGFLSEEYPDVAWDGAGNLYAVWSCWKCGAILFAVRPAGGSWGQPEWVSDSNDGSRNDPKLAVDTAGNAYVVWWDNRDLDSEGTNIYFASRPAGGGWSVNEKIDTLSGWVYAYYPEIGVDGGGNLYASWYAGSVNGDDELFFATRPAGGSWSASQMVSDPATQTYADHSALAVDPAGNVHLAWTQGLPRTLAYAYRPAGGSWGATEIVNSAGDVGEYVNLALLPGNGLAALWDDDRSGNPDVYLAIRPAGGPWGSNVRVNDDGGTTSQLALSLSADAAGNLYAAWQDYRTSLPNLYFAWQDSNTGLWSSNEKVNDPAGNVWDGAGLASDPAGNLYLAWNDSRQPSGTSNNDEIYGDYRPAGGSWGSDELVSLTGGGSGQGGPALIYNANGQATVLWQDSRLGNKLDIFADTLSGGAWGADVRVSDDGVGSYDQGMPAVAADASNNLYALWHDLRGGTQDIYFAIRDSNGVWSANSRVNTVTTNSQTYPSLAVSPAGDGYALWQDNRSGHNDIYFSYRPAGGSWAASLKVNNDVGSTAQNYPKIALDAAGNAYAVWEDGRNGNNDIYFSYRPAGGSWAANVRVNDDGGTASQNSPSLFVAPGGQAYAVWADSRNGNNDIYFSYRPAGGSWTTNVRLNDDTGTASQLNPDIAVDPAGNIFVAWSDNRAGLAVYATGQFNGSWTPNFAVNDAPSTWTPSLSLRPDVAIMATGRAAVAWQDERADLNTDIYFATLDVQWLPLAGPWSAPQQANDAAATGQKCDGDLVLDQVGNSYATWLNQCDGLTEVWFAWQDPAGQWQASEQVNDNPSAATFDPAIGVGPNGQPVVIWDDNRNGNWDVFLSQRLPGGGWAAAQPLNDDGGMADQWLPTVSVDGYNQVYAAWQDLRHDGGDIYFVTGTPGGSWAANEKVNDDPTTASQSDPDLVADPAGNAYLIWDDARNGQNDSNWDIYFAARPAGGNWGANEKVSDAPNPSEQWYPRLAVDNGGNSYAVWMDERNGNWDIYFATRPAGGSWGANERVNDDWGTAMQLLPNIAVDGAGNVTVIWKDYREGQWHIYAAGRNRDGQWGRNVRVNSGGNSDGDYFNRLGLAAHPSGNVTALWNDYRNGPTPDMFSATIALGPDPAMVLWQTSWPINTSTSQTEQENAGDLYARPGSYWLVGDLTSALGQQLAQDSQPFYIFPAGVALTLATSASVVAAGQPVTVSGRITNTALLPATIPLALYLGMSKVYSQSFSLAAGQGASYSAIVTPTLSLPVWATANGAEASQWLTVAEPEVAASLLAPSLVGSQPFSVTVTLSNTGLLPAGISLAIANQPPHPLTLLPGQIVQVSEVLTATAGFTLTAALSGDVSQTLSQAVAFGEGAALWLAAPAGPLPEMATLTYTITPTGSLPTAAALRLWLDGDLWLTRSLTLLAGQTYSGTLPLVAPAGPHSLVGELVTSGGYVLDSHNLAMTVAEAVLPSGVDLTLLDLALTPEPVPAGQPFQVTATFHNGGSSEPVIVAVQSFDDYQQWVITPTQALSQTLVFSQSVPADMPAGNYTGRVILGDESQTFTVPVSGVAIDLSLELDQPTHTAGQPISLTVTLAEGAGVSGVYRLSLQSPQAESYLTVTLPANGTLQHTFVFTATDSGRAAVSLGYAGQDGQRIIMIDSLPLVVVRPEQKTYLTFDQARYQAGETIWLTVHVVDTVGVLSLLGPMEMFGNEPLLDWNAPQASTGLQAVLTGTHTLSYTLPAELKSGQYTFVLLGDEGEQTYPVDVLGWHVTSLRADLGSPHYDPGQLLTARVEFESASPIAGLTLQAWLAPPDDGPLLLLDSYPVALEAGLNTFVVSGTFTSTVAGPHRLLVNLMSPDWGWRVAGAVAQFDSGTAHLVDLATDHGSYGLNEVGSGRVTLYGFGPTNLLITTTTGVTLLNTSLNLAGFSSLDFSLPTDGYGEVLLLARAIPAGGNPSQLLAAYEVVPPADTEPPILTLTYPAAHTIVTGTAPISLTVTGEVSDGGLVTEGGSSMVVLVNGQVVTPTVGGQFTATLPITRGANLLSVVAIDPAGNITMAPLIPIYLRPETQATLWATADPVQVNTSLTFNVVLTSSDVVSKAVYSQVLPADQVADMVVNASSGIIVASDFFSQSHTINWQGAIRPDQPVTLQISGRPMATGVITGTATLFWGWGHIETTRPVTITVIDSPTAITLRQIQVTEEASRPGTWPMQLLLWMFAVTMAYVWESRKLSKWRVASKS